MTTTPAMSYCQKCGATYFGWHDCPAERNAVQRVEISVVGLDLLAETARQAGRDEVIAEVEKIAARMAKFTDLPLSETAEEIAQIFRDAVAPFRSTP